MSPALAQGFINWPQNISWQVDTGFDYSSGKYGTATNTDVLSVPLEGKLQLGRFRLEASLPYLNIHGPGVVADGIVTGGSGSVTNRSGIGDLNVGAAVLANKDGDLPAVELEGIVKVPTAASGLGTGQTDYAIQANLYHYFTPNFGLFGSLGYQWLASFSTYQLKDGLFATLGANVRASDDVSVGVSASYRQEYYAGLGNAAGVSPYIMVNLAPGWRLSGYGSFGFDKASPDYDAGLRLMLFH
jgi:hypothetical protein